METEFFFVYGTLKVGGVFSGEFDAYRVNSEEAVVDNMDLYNLGWFPGIIPGNRSVIGELHEYKAPDLITDTMDKIEGYDGTKQSLFMRIRKAVIITRGKEIEATMYVYNGNVTKNMTLIENGVWHNENK